MNFRIIVPTVDDNLFESSSVLKVYSGLHPIDSQHQPEIEGLVTALSLIVVRRYDPFPLSPRDDAINLLEELLLTGCCLPRFVCQH